MNERWQADGASLIRLYGWLRETGEIDRLIDLVIEKVRDSRQTERAKDPEPRSGVPSDTALLLYSTLSAMQPKDSQTRYLLEQARTLASELKENLRPRSEEP